MMAAAAESLEILFVGGLPPFRAGSAISTYQLLAGLADRGHRVRAVAPLTPDTQVEGQRFAAESRRVAISWLQLPSIDYTPDIPASPEYRALESAEVQRVVPPLIAARRPDALIVGHEAWGWHIPEVGRAHALPMVQLVRGNPTRGILNGSYPLEPGRRLLAEFRKVDQIVCVARYMAEGLQRLGFANARHIWNAVDVEQFSPRPKSSSLLRSLAIDEQAVVVAHVATAKDIKRPMDLVDSAEKALRRDPRLVYLMVGDGWLRPALEQATRERGLAGRFRFVGWVPYEQVPDYINLADLVVLPSEGEGMARVYLEAQACGRVLIASDIAAAHEVIEHSQTGLLFPTGDTDALAAQTLLAAGDPALRAQIGRQARQRVEAHHTLSGAVSAYEAVLRQVVGRQAEARSSAADEQTPAPAPPPST
jgi:glycosyltransferase involved in cell wall biosynthesis